MLVAPLDFGGRAAGLVLDHIPQGDEFVIGCAHGQVEHLVNGQMSGIGELNEDAIGVAFGAVFARRRSGNRRLQDLADISHAESEVGGLVAIHLDFLLGHAFIETGVDVGHAGDSPDRCDGLLGQCPEHGQFKTADFDFDSGISAAQEPVEQELALPSLDAHFHAGESAAQALSQIRGDFAVGSGALVGGADREIHFEPATADFHDIGRHLGHGRDDDGFHVPGDGIDQFEASAHFHFSFDPDLAFIGGRHQFGADHGSEQEAPQQGQQGAPKDRRTMAQSGLEQRVIAVFQALEPAPGRHRQSGDRGAISAGSASGVFRGQQLG